MATTGRPALLVPDQTDKILGVYIQVILKTVSPFLYHNPH